MLEKIQRDYYITAPTGDLDEIDEQLCSPPIQERIPDNLTAASNGSSHNGEQTDIDTLEWQGRVDISVFLPRRQGQSVYFQEGEIFQDYANTHYRNDEDVDGMKGQYVS